jgi:hypothetical protein
MAAAILPGAGKSDAEARQLVDHLRDCNRHRRIVGVCAALDWLADNPPQARDTRYEKNQHALVGQQIGGELPK